VDSPSLLILLANKFTPVKNPATHLKTAIEMYSSFFLLSLVLVCNGINHYYNGNTTALGSKYPFHIALSTDPTYQYDLYWKVDLEEEMIEFAVNVSTSGWIGFGLSPNGQMPGSDVLIGWISDDGIENISVNTHLHFGILVYSQILVCIIYRIDTQCPGLYQFLMKVKIGSLLAAKQRMDIPP
jgi:hypothetical protein